MVGVVRQQLSHETDQPGGGFVPGAGDHGGVGEHLGARQGAASAVRLLDLGPQQVGHQVIGGMMGPPFDVLGEHDDGVLEQVWVDLTGLAALDHFDERSAAIPDVGLIGFRDAQEIADGPHRHHRPEIGDEIKPAGTDQRVQLPGAEATHQGLHGQHAPGREDTGQQAAMQIVQGWVLEQQNAWRHFDVGEQDVGGGPAAGPVGLPVRQFARDVLVPTQRVEVVLLVVVQRRFRAHAFPHRIRVVVDLDIERVVVQLDRASACHHHSLRGID